MGGVLYRLPEDLDRGGIEFCLGVTAQSPAPRRNDRFQKGFDGFVGWRRFAIFFQVNSLVVCFLLSFFWVLVLFFLLYF